MPTSLHSKNDTLETAVRERRIRDLPAQAALRGLAGRIGNTPLLRLTNVTAHLPPTVSVWAKAEFLNPGGSVKDRAALRMMLDGFRSGKLGHGATLIDATSGNTGIAYAMLGSILQVPVRLAVPANASPERLQIMRAFGARLILTDAMDGTDGAQLRVREMVEAAPEEYFYPDQYNNDSNWRAHFEGTGSEILEQSGNRVTHFVAALGTTGTFAGTSRRLKQYDAGIRCFALQPDAPLHGMEGVKHLPSAIVPGIYDPDLADETLICSTEDAQEMTRRLAREEGLLVGVSSGANVSAALSVAEGLASGTVVTILCDAGNRYLSDDFWTEA